MKLYFTNLQNMFIPKKYLDILCASKKVTDEIYDSNCDF